MTIKNKYAFTVVIFVVALLMPLSSVFAHVTVKPNQAGIATWQTFTMGVPNEKDISTTNLRLVIPEGLSNISPNVKPGWKIEIKSVGEGEQLKVTEIIWSGGTIPEGQRDDFQFSAKVPAEETTLQWKAYQTYQDGTVVSWDQSPLEEKHDEMDHNNGPFSETKIVNDMTKTPVVTANDRSGDTKITAALMLSLVSLALSVSGYVKNKK